MLSMYGEKYIPKESFYNKWSTGILGPDGSICAIDAPPHAAPARCPRTHAAPAYAP